MATSQNGWPVIAKSDDPRLRSFQLPDVNRKLLAREGSAGFLLVHIALWFDEELEDLEAGVYDDWGWAYRPISGSSVFSNHSSGTAIDLNATKHPMGVSTNKTFSGPEIARIHNRLRMYSGCIRWGGDYDSRPDAMHYEINRSKLSVDKKARQLIDTKRGRRICEANKGLRKEIL